MTVVLLTDDLMTASRVEGVAQRTGVAVKTLADAASVVSHCSQHQVDQLIVDLSARSCNVATIIEQLGTAAVARPPIIAFGPHVHDELLAAAAEAGCEQVVSRGQFFAQLGATFARFADSTAGQARRDQDASPGG